MENKAYLTDVNKPLTDVEVDKYYLVIGVEANASSAYQEAKITFSSKTAKHQYLSGPNLDWGHAFFYIVENDTVFSFFSFGPSGGKKLGENRFIGNASTCQYLIGEVAQLYILDINADIANQIKAEVDSVKRKSNNQIYNEKTEEWEYKESNDKKYRAITNETCAKEAFSILYKALSLRIPDAHGYVKMYGISKGTICPYAWHENLNNSKLEHYTYPEYPKIGKAKELLAAFKNENNTEIDDSIYTYYLRTEHANGINFGVMVPEFDKDNTTDWRLLEGEEDPLIVYSYF